MFTSKFCWDLRINFILLGFWDELIIDLTGRVQQTMFSSWNPQSGSVLEKIHSHAYTNKLPPMDPAVTLASWVIGQAGFHENSWADKRA